MTFSKIIYSHSIQFRFLFRYWCTTLTLIFDIILLHKNIKCCDFCYSEFQTLSYFPQAGYYMHISVVLSLVPKVPHNSCNVL